MTGPKPTRLGKTIRVEYPEGKGENPMFRSTKKTFRGSPDKDGITTYQSHIEIPDNREATDNTRVAGRKAVPGEAATSKRPPMNKGDVLKIRGSLTKWMPR